MKKFIILGASVLGLLSSFLPWASVEFMGMSKSVSGMDGGDGVISILLFLVIGILSLTGNFANMITKIVISICALCSVLLGFYEISNLSKGQGLVSTGFGLYLLILMGVVVIGVLFGMKNETSSAAE
ncbi:hypothetical protein N9M15_06490 [Bacteroidia bacterium]|nr:hypothetical protein [Bacteroidia bacterium]